MENDKNISFYTKLNNGYNMPRLGLGTHAIPNIEEIVYDSIKSGVRHFDCAKRYKNEIEIGRSIKKAILDGLVTREELFITTKLSMHERSDPFKAIKQQLNDMQLDYFDLYLDHVPFTILEINGVIVRTPLHVMWSQLEDLVTQGLTKSIGVSNYNVQNLMNLLSFCKIKPVVNEIEFHPYLTQPKLIEYCQKNEIIVLAFNSLVRGTYVYNKYFDNKEFQVNLLEEDLVINLAKKYSKTPGQIALNWALSQDIIVIPATNTLGRMKENLLSLSFVMDECDIKDLNKLNRNLRFDLTFLFEYSQGVEISA
jgi:diketogulonate reductase-like aldo/keto reductase